MGQLVIFILMTASVLAASRLVDAQENLVAPSTSYTVKTTAGYSTIKPTTTSLKHHKDRWLMYVSAGPTVIIFLICVIAISVKNCSGDDKYPEDENSLTPTATSVPTSPMAMLKPKTKMVNEVYDKMLEQFKDDKNKNKTFVGRKCSQIHIRGVESGSPKSLARKHIIIGKLSGNKEEDIAEDENEDPVGSLVRSSTATFIGGPVPAVREMRKNESINSDDTAEMKDTVRGILKTSIDDLTEADRRSFCDELNKVLLPEDLEEAFKDFEYWAESYA